MNNVTKWLVNRGGLMEGEHIIYITTAPDGTERIIGVQTDPEKESTYHKFEGENWDDFSEYNHECYVYGRRI